MAIILPLVRELNLWIFSNLLGKSTNYDLTIPLVPKLTATIVINIDHAFFVAIIIANSSTPGTSYAILAVDFILNLYNTYRIIKLHRKTISSDALETENLKVEKKEETLKLFAIETVEFLAPLAYATTFLLAYNGPNPNIIGNVRNSDWSYKGVEDVERFVTILMKMFLVDFGSLIISVIMLWKVASLSFFEEGYKMLKLYWPLIAVKVGGKVFQVH
jgi:hypothetical protein